MSAASLFREQRRTYRGPTSPVLLDAFVMGVDYLNADRAPLSRRIRSLLKVQNYNGPSSFWMMSESQRSDAELYRDYCEAVESVLESVDFKSELAQCQVEDEVDGANSLISSLIRVCGYKWMYFWDFSPYSLDWWIAGRRSSVRGTPRAVRYDREWQTLLAAMGPRDALWYRRAWCGWGPKTWSERLVEIAQSVVSDTPGA
jgi:hypothetical protein